MTWAETIDRYIAEGRTVSGGKGEGTAKAQMDKQNALQQSAYDRMVGQQAKAEAAVQPYMSGKEGYDPALLSAMMSQFMNQSSRNYNQAGSNLRAAMQARGSGGGDKPIGGDFVRGVASLEGARAQDLSQGVANINMQNLQAALQNKWNAVNVVNGQAAQMSYPIMTFGQGASNALNQYMQAANSGFGATFMRGLGGALSSAIGGGLSAGMGGFMGGFGGGGGGAGGLSSAGQAI